jgi:hypothetical protein
MCTTGLSIGTCKSVLLELYVQDHSFYPALFFLTIIGHTKDLTQFQLQLLRTDLNYFSDNMRGTVLVYVHGFHCTVFERFL